MNSCREKSGLVTGEIAYLAAHLRDALGAENVNFFTFFPDCRMYIRLTVILRESQIIMRPLIGEVQHSNNRKDGWDCG